MLFSNYYGRPYTGTPTGNPGITGIGLKIGLKPGIGIGIPPQLATPTDAAAPPHGFGTGFDGGFAGGLFS